MYGIRRLQVAFTSFLLAIAPAAYGVTWIKVNGETDAILEVGQELDIALDCTPGGEVIVASAIDANGNGEFDPGVDLVDGGWMYIDGSTKDEDPRPGFFKETLAPQLGTDVGRPILLVATEVGSGATAHCRAVFRIPVTPQGVRGLATTPDGAPAPGAIVWAAYGPGLELDDPTDARSLWAALTEEDGSFVIYVPHAGSYLVGTGEGESPGQPTYVAGDSFVEGIRLILPPEEPECVEPTYSLSGTITDESGQPLPFVEVEIYDPRRNWEMEAEVSTDLQGRYEAQVRSGRKYVSIELDGYLTDRHYEIYVPQDAPLDVEMRRAPYRIEGVVRDALTDAPLADVEVETETADFLGTDDDDTSLAGRYLCWTDGGDLELEVETELPCYERFSEPLTIVGDTTRDILMTPMTATVRGKVRDDRGDDLFWVYVEARNTSREYSTTPATVTDPDGGYSLCLTPGDTYEISFFKPGWEPERHTDVTLSEGETLSLDWQLPYVSEPPLLTEGRVAPASGDSNTEFLFEVVYSDPDGDPPARVVVTIDGSTFEMDRIDGGDPDYAAGVTYVHVATLRSGSHSYSFSAEDSHGVSASIGPGERHYHRGPCVEPAPVLNDDCRDASPIVAEVGAPASWTVDLSGATVEPAEPEGCWNTSHNTAWYLLSPAEPGVVTITANPQEPHWNTEIAIFEGDCGEGVCWRQGEIEDAPHLRSIHIVEMMDDGEVTAGWVVGDGGFIDAPGDPQNSGTTEDLFSVFAVDADLCWAAGDAGTIVHTIDGGATWSPQDSGVGSALRCIRFVDENTGLAAGDAGVILRTEDGGATWTPMTSGAAVTLRGLWMISDVAALAVGDGGTVLRTTDGSSWTAIEGLTSQDLHGIVFAGPANGLAGGAGGTILHTPDGGDTWTESPSGSGETLYGVEAVDSLDYWAVGANGTVLHTVDGGETWSSEPSDTIDDIYSVSFASKNFGMAAGANGLIVGAEPCEPERLICDAYWLNFFAQAGAEYRIRIGSDSVDPGLVDVTLEFAPCEPPPNDDCADAEAIGPLPHSTDLKLCWAAEEPAGPPGCDTVKATAWYSHLAQGSGVLRIEASSPDSWEDASIDVFRGSCGSLTHLGCGRGQLDLFGVEQGELHYVRVGTWSPSDDSFRVSVDYIDCLEHSSKTVWPEGDVLPGDTLTYTVRVFSSCSLTNVTLTDAISPYATYVPGSTKRNGESVPDKDGRPPFEDGMLLDGWDTVEYKVRVDWDAEAGSIITNTAVISSDQIEPTERPAVNIVVAPPVGPPPNDECPDAMEIASLPHSDEVDIRGATIGPEDPPSHRWIPRHTVWYRYAPPETEQLTVRGSSRTIQGTIDVFRGSCDDLAWRGSLSWWGESILLSAGEVYLIRVGTWDTAGETVELDFSSAPATCLDFSVKEVDPPGNAPWGRELRYEIRAINGCDVPVTGACVADPVPEGATYVPGSTTLNGSPVPDLPGGASPLEECMSVNSPGQATGVIEADGVARVEFKVTVNEGTATGSSIANAATIQAQTPSPAFPVVEAYNAAVAPPDLPPNDDCRDAAEIPSLPYQVTQDIRRATVAPGESGEIFPGVPRNTVWYRYEAPSDGHIIVRATGEDFGPVVDAFSGPCESPEWIGSSFWTPEAVSVRVENGEEYRIRVGSLGDFAGQAVISVDWTPDLRVDSVTAPPLVRSGESVPVSWILANEGAGIASAPWQDQLYLSSDDQAGDDEPLRPPARLQEGSLEPGGRLERMGWFDYPEGTEPGLYWIVVKADAGDEVPESDESNNVRVADEPIRLQPPLRADLVVSEIIPPVDGVTSGSMTEVTFVVTNQSPDATDASFWWDSVFLTSAEELNADLLRERYFLRRFENPGALSSGESYLQTVPIRLPERVSGDYHIAVYADSRRPRYGAWWKCSPFDVLERDECNNWAFSPPFRIDVGTLPDLQVTSVTTIPAGKALMGRNFEIRWTVENTGGVPTREVLWFDDVYLSNNDSPSVAGDFWFGGSFLYIGGPLAPGQSYPGELKTLFPRWEGEFAYVKVVTDRIDSMWEVNKENNVGVSGRIAVNPLLVVDLEPWSVSAPASAVPGQWIEVTWCVRKVGGFSSDAGIHWQDGIYLSEDADWDPEEDCLLDRQDCDPVMFARTTTTGPGGAIALPDYCRTASVLIPSDVPELALYIIVVVDVNDHIFEGWDDDNNWRASENPMSVTPISTDLAVAVPCGGANPVPPSAAAGDAINLSWEVRNRGELETLRSFWRDAVYFSVDDILSQDDILLTAADRTSAVEPGESYCFEGSAEIPVVCPGSYSLIFATDIDGVVPEISPLPGGEGKENNVVVKAFEVLALGPNLVVTQLQGPETAESSSPVRIEWTVQNQGNLETRAAFWTDRVYLSWDGELSDDDILIGSETRTEPLAAGDSYTVKKDFTLPAHVGGAFRVIVRTDDDDDVSECTDENNTFAKEMLLSVDRFPPANLRVSDVATSDAVLSGQVICVSWTVTNTGDGATDATSWEESVYLSRGDGEIYLGSYKRQGALGPGESYRVERQCFDLPFGLSGPYFVFVRADSSERIYEGGEEEDNEAFARDALEVTLPPKSDLTVAEALPPPSGVLGEDVRVEWALRNNGAENIEGRWYDSVYLSADETWDIHDPRLGRFETALIGTLEPGVTHPSSGQAPVVVKPGDYRIIVRTDVHDQIPEVDEENNLGASAGTLRVTANALDLDGGSIEGPLLSGQEKYFELQVTAASEGETVRVYLEHEDPLASTELYVRYGELPTIGRFDFVSRVPGESQHSVKIPQTEAGSYFVLVRATDGTFQPGGSEMTLQAATVPFSVDSVTPDRVGHTGRASLTVDGSRFEPGATVELEDADGSRLKARRVEVKSGAELIARFLLDDAPRGPYRLLVTNPGGATALLNDALVVEDLAPPLVAIEAQEPPSLRRGTSGGAWTWEVVNRGNVDAEYVFLLQSIEETEGREVIDVRSSTPFPGDAARDGVFLPSALVRSLAPGRSAALSTSLRAGTDPGDHVAVGQAVALLSTERFLRFELAVAEAVRWAIIADPALLLPDARNSLLALAQDRDTWRDYWFARLAEAGLVDEEDVGDLLSLDGDFPGNVQCQLPKAGKEAPPFCQTMPERLCAEWLARLVELGADATEAFETSPAASAVSQLTCSLEDLVACTSCGYWSVTSAVDPNEKEGSDGFADENLVPAGKAIRYRVHFENLETATAPAAVVRIRDPIDPALNPGSFVLEEVFFGRTAVPVGDNQISLYERIDLRAIQGVDVDVLSGVDPRTNEVFMTFRSVDPLTGETPTEGSVGFLSPNDDTGVGQGWAQFSLKPKAGSSSGIVIRNEATITFDAEEPIHTNAVTHTLDADLPESSVDSFAGPSQRDPVIALSWSGTDEGGSGVAAYTIYVSTDGEPFVPLLPNTTEKSADYEGEPGHSYGFYSLAVDHAGNVEEAPPRGPDGKIVPDAEVTILRDPLFRRGDSDADGPVNITDSVYLLSFLFLGGPPPPCTDAADCDDSGGLNITDAVCILGYLFLGAEPPRPPGATRCGLDPSPDDLPECQYSEESCAP